MFYYAMFNLIKKIDDFTEELSTKEKKKIEEEEKWDFVHSNTWEHRGTRN